MSTRRLMLGLAIAVIVLFVGWLFVLKMLLSHPGTLTVTIENRTDRPLMNGRYILNGHKTDAHARDLAAPFDQVPARKSATGTFRAWSGNEVQFVYDLERAKDFVVSCGYPDDGVDVWSRILAEGDSMWVDSTSVNFGRGEISSLKFSRDGKVISSRSSQYR